MFEKLTIAFYCIFKATFWLKFGAPVSFLAARGMSELPDDGFDELFDDPAPLGDSAPLADTAPPGDSAPGTAPEPAEQAATPGEPTDPPELMERVWVSFADGWSVGIVVEVDAAEDTLLDP